MLNSYEKILNSYEKIFDTKSPLWYSVGCIIVQDYTPKGDFAHFVTIQSHAKLRSAMPKYAEEAAGDRFSAMLAFRQKSSFIWRSNHMSKREAS